MRGDGAGAAAAGGAFEGEEESDAGGNGGHGLKDGEAALGAAEGGDGEAGGGPQPAVATAGGGEHPEADPARGGPAMDAAHETVVGRFDEGEHAIGERDHEPSMAGGGESSMTGERQGDEAGVRKRAAVWRGRTTRGASGAGKWFRAKGVRRWRWMCVGMGQCEF